MEAIGPEIIAQRLEPILTSSFEEGYKILKEEYKNFLSNVNDNPVFDKFKSNTNFLIVLSQVCISFPLSYEERVYCNAMIYKQMNTANDFTKSILINIGFLINRTIVYKLMNCGLDIFLSTYIAVARKSSFDVKDNISRLNFCINCVGPQFMTVQRITDIYCAVADTYDEISELFYYLMNDPYVYISDAEWITPDVKQTAKNMDYAVINIIESLPTEVIERILMNYYNSCRMNRSTVDDVRFSFKHFEVLKFPKIASVLDQLSRTHIYLL